MVFKIDLYLNTPAWLGLQIIFRKWSLQKFGVYGLVIYAIF